METSKQQTVVSQNVRNQNDEVEIDLVEIFSLLLSRIWILILITILGAGVAGGYTALFMEPKYQAKSEIFILNTSVELSLADIQVGSQLTQDYIELITSRPVIEKVISELKLDMNYKTFKTNLSVTNPSNTRILYLTITNTDAYMAKTIVDKLTDVAIDYIAAVMETDRPNVIDYGPVWSGTGATAPAGSPAPTGRSIFSASRLPGASATNPRPPRPAFSMTAEPTSSAPWT